MDLMDVLADIEKLVGLELNPINPRTESIKLTRVDYKTQNYYIKPKKGREVRRTFAELEKIWVHLLQEKAINVETILEGAGSSRYHPETVLANLPYIDHFKYNRKKHLYLQCEETHQLGELHQLENTTLRAIRRTLNNKHRFDPLNFSIRLAKVRKDIELAFCELSEKYPTEIQSSSITSPIEELEQLINLIKGTFVTTSLSFDLADMTNLDSESMTGFVDEDEDEDDEDDEEKHEDTIKDYNNDEIDEIEIELSAARIRHLSPTISLVFDRLRHNEIELQPEYQRRDRIWPLKNKSSLIESILIGLPIPNLYFAERDSGDWVVVDGLQRLTTIQDFIQGQFKLTNLQILKHLEGQKYQELTRYYQRKYLEHTLHCHIVRMDKDDDSIVNELFQRINTYGVRLSYQEIRCSLYRGSSVMFIRYLAESEKFKNTTFYKISSQRMKDMEFVLGAVAFILLGFKNYNYNKFDSFLGNAMKKMNQYPINITGKFLTSQDENENPLPPKWNDEGTHAIYKDIKNKIESAFKLAEKIFGDHRYQKSGKNKPVLSKPLFELIISSFTNLSEEQSSILLKRKNIFLKEFDTLLNGERIIKHDWISDVYRDENRDFYYSISQSTGKKVTILYRYQNFIDLLEDIIGSPITFKGLLNKYAE